MAGKIECTSVATGFTVNSEYDVLGFTGDFSSGAGVVTRDDNGDFRCVDPNGASFTVTELYAETKVI